jgi:hypothetical protein
VWLWALLAAAVGSAAMGQEPGLAAVQQQLLLLKSAAAWSGLCRVQQMRL